MIKIFKDLLKCKEHNRRKPKPIKVDAIINKTKCYNFIHILLSVGYYRVTHSKQIKFDTANIHKIKDALDTVTKYKNELLSASNSMTLSRQTIKMQMVHKSNSKSVDYISKNQLSSRYASPIKLGAYSIKNVVGKGAFGTVYRCKTEEKKSATFAMKTFNKKSMKQHEYASVLSEIRILSKLAIHPHTVRLVEVVENDYFIGIVLPFYPNGSLLSFIKEFGVGMLTELHCKAFLFQILTAVAFLHQSGIIHRDIKAANVLINHDGMCILCDFGIAEYANEFDEKEASNIIGTPNWMAPEIIGMLVT